MGKFNRKNNNKVMNHEGAKAYPFSHELDLYNLTVTSVIDDKFYESKNAQIERLVKLIRHVPPEYICQLAIYAREKMYLRSIPLVLMVELLKVLTMNDFDRRLLGNTITRIINRPDEITEILSYYQTANHRTAEKKLNRLSKQLQAGIANAFNKFDEYQLAKYNRKNQITLRDALFLSHPKAKDAAQQAVFDKIINRSLAAPYTWEVTLSAQGNTKASWVELLDSGKLGYMALLRNLKNILLTDISESYLIKIAGIIADKNKVLKSKQLPVRFYSAYTEIKNLENAKFLMEALENAMKYSIDSVEFFNGRQKILAASDVSGSMSHSVSKNSKVQYYDIGLLFSMLLNYKLGHQVTTGIFGETWKVKNLSSKLILGQVDDLKKMQGEVGYATNGYKVLEWLVKNDYHYDKILFFTDCELYNTQNDRHIADLWQHYKKNYPPAKIYFFNLAGYATSPIAINEKEVYNISGWSDRVFEMLSAIENGSSIVNEIKKIKIS